MVCTVQYFYKINDRKRQKKTEHYRIERKKKGTGMSDRQRKTETFIVKVMNQQNATWQGSVTWVDEQREQYFRSALELLKLIDGALEKTKDDSDEDKRRTP